MLDLIRVFKLVAGGVLEIDPSGSSCCDGFPCLPQRIALFPCVDSCAFAKDGVEDLSRFISAVINDNSGNTACCCCCCCWD